MIELISFTGALKKVKNLNECHVLIGNGFSIACAPELFSYQGIHEVANANGLDNKVKRIFKALGTNDFEEVIQKMENSAKLINIYSKSYRDLAEKLIKDSKNLRKKLVETIALNHPMSPHDIPPERYLSCCAFLANFKKIFTTNYDLLLYWTCFRSRTFTSDDGFRNSGEHLTWNNCSTQNLFYLHGALHLYQNGNNIIKLAYKSTGEPLFIQINLELQDNKYPLIVTGGASEDKLSRILRNRYLKHCYQNLSKLKGALFIHGLSLADNDEHLLKAIETGKVKQLFISIHKDAGTPQNKRIIGKIEALRVQRDSKKPLETCYYDADSAAVWDGVVN